MLSEQIRGIASHVIVGLLTDDKIIRLLYPIADEVDKLKDDLERVNGERVQFGDRAANLEAKNQELEIDRTILILWLVKALNRSIGYITKELKETRVRLLKAK